MTHSNQKFKLIVRQQPLKARLCSFKEKVDRRPIDPPPIVQLVAMDDNDNIIEPRRRVRGGDDLHNNNEQDDEVDEVDEYLQNPYFFLYITLLDATSDADLHFLNGNRTTAGTVVQSLHRLKDTDNTEGGFFIFSDVSVRLEGAFRLKFTLFEIIGATTRRICHVNSEVFQVYSPKSFPGMSESTFLTRSFSDQGVRIRIRKEPRASTMTQSTSTGTLKRRRSTIESDESLLNHPHGEDSFTFQNSQMASSAITSRQMVVLPSPREILRSSAMSMQNILSSTDSSEHHDLVYSKRKLPFPNAILPPPKTISPPLLQSDPLPPTLSSSKPFHWQNPSEHSSPPSPPPPF